MSSKRSLPPEAARATRQWIAPVVVGSVLLIIYCATLAPTVTLWDAGEFLSAIHSLGIPHPPGTPVFVLIANVWAKIFSPLFGFAYSVNLFSAVCTALACAILASLFGKWTGNTTASIAGGLTAGLMSSVWLNATETEVYSPALLVSLLLLLVADNARRTREARWLIVLAYLTGLGWALQLSALVAAPAALFLALWRNDDDPDPVSVERADEDATLAWKPSSVGVPGAMLVVALIGASAVLFMLVRARHDPAVNQGNPATFQALSDVVARKQYHPAGMLPRQAPFYLQVGNLFEYADWQVALSLAPDPPPSAARTGMTLVFAMLGVAGFFWHKRIHRPSWEAMTLLFFSATVGIVLYLNMKASPSYGVGFLPRWAKHEARERDYFFVLGFLCWGLWAGAGVTRVFARYGRTGKIGAFAIAFLPAVLNWKAVSRNRAPDSFAARDSASRILARAPRNAVVFAVGDNDTYPVWYMQEVEGLRRDVTPVTLPLLGAKWYREELARRHHLLDSTYVESWRGLGATYIALCARSRALGRPVLAANVRGEVPDACK